MKISIGEVLYYYYQPMLMTIVKDEELRLAMCHDMHDDVVRYYSVETSRDEIKAMKDGRISVRATLEGKPWEEVELTSEGDIIQMNRYGRGG